MRKIVQMILLAAMTVVMPHTAYAKSITFEELRALAAKGKPEVMDVHQNHVPSDGTYIRYSQRIEEKIYLAGVVAASPLFPRHANHEMPYNTASYEISAGQSMSTCYMQSEDGRYGVKIRFPNEKAARSLKNFGHAEINLKGTTLIKEGNCYIIEDCTPEHVVYSEPGVVAEMPKKEKYVSELNDDDLYTYVTIKDCEFVFKNGSFSNVIEQSLTRTASGRNQGFGRADGWQGLLMDGEGGLIYAHFNAKTTNRRIGGGLPQGCGSISGTLVDTYNPRFGETSVRYGIRPHSDEDVNMDWMGTPGYKTVAAWDWNINQTAGFFPAEYGAGYMACDIPGVEVRRTDDWDNTHIDLPDERQGLSKGLRGAVTNGAMQLVARTCDWWDWEQDCGRSLMLICSTQNVKGSDFFLAFSVAAGNRSTDTSYGYPSYWKIQWSVDGVNYTDVDAADINVRGLWHDWWGRQVKNVDQEYYELPYEAAIGFAEHLVHLPVELLGQKRIYLKITPSRKVVASLGYLGRDNVTLRPNMEENCYMNFGEVIIGYR